MFRKLRWKFVWVSTAILFCVIVAVVGIVNWSASSTIMSQTRILMEEILDNNGELPGYWDFDLESSPFLALNQESIYETRYFTARISDDHIEIPNLYIRMQEEDAIEIAEKVYLKREGFGRLSTDGHRMINYMKRTEEDGSIFMVILDSTSRYALIRVVLMYLSVLWLSVLVLYIIIMGRYSGKLVQPFIENDEKQKRFITNASHELKTPLTVISSNTEMMEATGGKTKWTESTRRQLGKLQNLIEDLVVLSRLDEMQELALSKLALSPITMDTVELFRSVIEGAGKKLISDIKPNVSGMTEKRSYQQLVSILMDNASKYCDAGGEIRVSLVSHARGKGARLSVANTFADGKNVDYSRFFERFYREDASHNSSVSGFGIGLSMAKEITERLGGRIKVEYAGDRIMFHVDIS